MIKAAVLGSPISHSLSPHIHSLAYEFLGVKADYSRFEVKSGELSKFLLSHSELNALSLTMPLKEEALLIADYVSDLSTQISSGNTLTKLDEKWYLTSTDVAGFTESIASNNVLLDGAVLVIGSGATARAFVASCNADDRLQSGQVHVIHRNPERQKQMRTAAPNLDLVFHQWDSCSLINEMSLVVNTTPAGVADVFGEAIDKPRGVFFEALYNPWPTRVLEKWRNQDGRTIDGIDLLVHQAISQVEIFSKKTVDRKTLSALMRSKAIEVLQQSTA